jgi:hypothetical protein
MGKGGGKVTPARLEISKAVSELAVFGGEAGEPGSFFSNGV